MRRIYLFSLLMAVLFPFTASHASTEYVINGNMESYSNPDTVPDSYSARSNNGVVFSRTTGYSGYGMQIVANNTGRLVAPMNPITIGSYALSFYAKGKGRIPTIRYSTNPSSAGSLPAIASDVSIDAADWTKHEIPFTVTEANTYYMYFYIALPSGESSATFYMDDISIQSVELPLSNDATLKSISVQGPSADTKDRWAIPGVSPGQTAYDVDLWFGADTIPNVIVTTNHSFATSIIDKGASNAFGDATSKSIQITVTAEDGQTQNIYTVTFHKTNDFIAGGFFNQGLSTGEFAVITNMYNQNDISHGLYFGNCAYRPSASASGKPAITTCKLINGAGTLSLWSGKYSNNIIEDAIINLEFSYTINGVDFTPFGELWRIDNIGQRNNANRGEWQEKVIPVNVGSGDVQIKIEYKKGAGYAGDFPPINIDDIRITPFGTTAIPDVSAGKTSLNIYAGKQSIIIAEQTAYNVYTTSGLLIASGNNNSGQTKIPVKPGLYIVKAGNDVTKILVN